MDDAERAEFGQLVEVVRVALENAAGKMPLLIWRACSAIAHGDMWATINRVDE